MIRRFAAAVERAVAQIPTPSLDSGVTTDDADTPVTPSESGRTLDPATPDAATADAATGGSESARNTSRVSTRDPDQSCDRRMTSDVVVDVRQVEMDDQSIRRAVMGAPRAEGRWTEWPVVDASAIPASLKSVAKAVTVAPVSAGYVKDKAGNVMGVVPAANGRTLDQTATAKAIAANLAARGTGAAAKPVKASSPPSSRR